MKIEADPERKGSMWPTGLHFSNVFARKTAFAINENSFIYSIGTSFNQALICWDYTRYKQTLGFVFDPKLDL